jgi:hypothetical protein
MELVNGFRCKDCTDVAYAKKNIDPAHPKDGPFGIDRQDTASPPKPGDSFGQAVKFDGALSGAGDTLSADNRRPTDVGTALDISA